MSPAIPRIGSPSALRLKASKPPKITITPVKTGALVQHFTGGLSPGVNSGKRFVFPNSDQLLKHIARASRRFNFDSNKLKGV